MRASSGNRDAGDAFLQGRRIGTRGETEPESGRRRDCIEARRSGLAIAVSMQPVAERTGVPRQSLRMASADATGVHEETEKGDEVAKGTRED